MNRAVCIGELVIIELIQRMTEQTCILVTVPHPDDAETRMAGSVARWTREGKTVIYVVCSNGDKGTNDPDITPQQLVEIREKEQLAAAEILGLTDVVFLRYPDQGVKNTPAFRKDFISLVTFSICSRLSSGYIGREINCWAHFSTHSWYISCRMIIDIFSPELIHRKTDGFM